MASLFFFFGIPTVRLIYAFPLSNLLFIMALVFFSRSPFELMVLLCCDTVLPRLEYKNKQTTYICLWGPGLFITNNLGRMWIKTLLQDSFLMNKRWSEVKTKNVIIISECCWRVIVHQNVCLIQGAIVWVWGDRKWILRTTIVTQILKH